MHCEGKTFAWCDCACALGRKVQGIDTPGSVGDVCDDCALALEREVCACPKTCNVHPEPKPF